VAPWNKFKLLTGNCKEHDGKMDDTGMELVTPDTQDQGICQHIQTVWGLKAEHGPGTEEGERLAGNTKLYLNIPSL
jgi:hypothetical protein